MCFTPEEALLKAECAFFAIGSTGTDGKSWQRTATAMKSLNIVKPVGVVVWLWTITVSQSGIKLHTLLDLHGKIPFFVEIADAKRTDSSILDAVYPERGPICVMDHACLDYRQLLSAAAAHQVY